MQNMAKQLCHVFVLRNTDTFYTQFHACMKRKGLHNASKYVLACMEILGGADAKKRRTYTVSQLKECMRANLDNPQITCAARLGSVGNCDDHWNRIHESNYGQQLDEFNKFYEFVASTSSTNGPKATVAFPALPWINRIGALPNLLAGIEDTHFDAHSQSACSRSEVGPPVKTLVSGLRLKAFT